MTLLVFKLKTYYHKIELLIFVGLLLSNCSLLFITKYFPTHDGGAHAYNTNIIYNLIFEKNSIYHQFYKLSHEVLPNWISYFFLLSLKPFISFELAEKLLLLLFFALTPIVFRILVKFFNPNNIELTYLIFPFLHFSLLYMGFFNFFCGILLFLVTTTYYLHIPDKFRVKHQFFLFICMLATFFAHIFCLVAILLFIFTHTIYYFILNYKKTGSIGVYKWFKRLILLVFLPSVVIFYWVYQYFSKRPSEGKETFLNSDDIIKMITELRPLIAFGDGEQKYTIILFFAISLLFISAISLKVYCIIKNKSFSNSLHNNDIFLALGVLFALLAFVLPNEDGYGGYITLRLIYFMFLFIIVWIATNSIRRIIWIPCMLIFLGSHFFLLKEKSNGVKFLNAQIKKLEIPMKLIENNKILIPTYWAQDYLWQGYHFNNYIAANKNIMILENYEADTKYFPVLWKENFIPYVEIDGSNNDSSCHGWKSGPKHRRHQKADYVLFFGEQSKNDCYSKLIETVSKKYSLIYIKDDIRLYKL